MQRTNIYLEERQTVALDEIAAAEGVSRSDVIRRLIDEGLQSGSAGFESDIAAIDASFGSLRGASLDVDRLRGPEPDTRARHLEAIWESAT